jgi:hypothetical protein
MELKNLSEARYLLEHRQLPNFLYKTKKDSVKGLLQLVENLAYSTFKNNCDENGIEFPYTEGDFKAKNIFLAENVKAVKLEMPKPEDEPQCYAVYFVYTPDCSRMYYFTVEMELHSGQQHLGGWLKKAHFNHGLVMMNEESQKKKILEVFNTSPIINKR